jgi:hypothetical protein
MIEFIKDNMKLVFLVVIVLLLVGLIIWAVLITKDKNKNKYTNIDKQTILRFDDVPPSLKCTYNINFSVTETGSTKSVQTLLDRKSPTIKLDMSTGKMIIEFLTTPKSLISAETDDIKNRLSVNSNLENVETETSEGEEEEILSQIGCSCPTEEIATRVREALGIHDGPKVPEMMRVVTPSISFQKKNKIEIRINIREIDILLNNELFHSALLDYVPYLFPGDSVALPEDASTFITLNSVQFSDSVRDD